MRNDIRQRVSVLVGARGGDATWPPEHLISLTRWCERS